MDSHSVIEFDCFRLEINSVGLSETSLVIYQSTPCKIQDHLGIVTLVATTIQSVNEFRNSAPSIHFARP